MILRSDGQPTYHLSVVVDDIDMAITHVVRGDDHISNTPKQVLLYEAFGKPAPQFAHVPLIMGPDKKRLSKRHGATSVTEYQRMGYLPEAMVNFLALLGWSPGGDREVLSRDELKSAVRARRHQRRQRRVQPREAGLVQPAAHRPAGRPRTAASGSKDAFARPDCGATRWTHPSPPWIVSVLDLLKPRVKKLDQLVDELRPFLVDRPEIDPAAASKHLSSDVRPLLAQLAGVFEKLEPFEAGPAEQALRGTAEEAGVKAAALIHATRVAVTGRAVSAGLFDLLVLLGRQRVIDRLRRAVNYTPPA